MTETAFQKKRYETRKRLANSTTKSIYGMYAEEMKRQLDEQANLLKEQEAKNRRHIIHLYFKEGKTLEDISDFLELSLKYVEAVITDYKGTLK